MSDIIEFSNGFFHEQVAFCTGCRKQLTYRSFSAGSGMMLDGVIVGMVFDDDGRVLSGGKHYHHECVPAEAIDAD